MQTLTISRDKIANFEYGAIEYPFVLRRDFNSQLKTITVEVVLTSKQTQLPASVTFHDVKVISIKGKDGRWISLSEFVKQTKCFVVVDYPGKFEGGFVEEVKVPTIELNFKAMSKEDWEKFHIEDINVQVTIGKSYHTGLKKN